MLKYEIITHSDTLPLHFEHYIQDKMLIPSHWHHHVEIIYITKGHMTVTTNDGTYLLETDDLFVVNAGVIHLTLTQEVAHVLLLQIPYDFLSNNIPDMDSRQFRSYFQHKVLQKEPPYLEMTQGLRKLLDLYEHQVPGYTFLFNSVLNRFLYDLYTYYSREATPAPMAKDRHRLHLEKAFDYMTSHYNEKVTLKDMASHLALNPEYFCRLFKGQVGITFLEYLNQIRLAKIYEDLIHTEDTLTDICERHGFSNYKVFSRMFKATYGSTPSAVRK